VKSNKQQGKQNEKVMVVSRSDIFANGIWNGIRTENLQKYLKIFRQNTAFYPGQK